MDTVHIDITKWNKTLESNVGPVFWIGKFPDGTYLVSVPQEKRKRNPDDPNDHGVGACRNACYCPTHQIVFGITSAAGCPECVK